MPTSDRLRQLRLRQLWRPPAETIAGVAAVLREHWRAAAKMRPARLFWPTPGRWLNVRPAEASAPDEAANESAADSAR